MTGVTSAVYTSGMAVFFEWNWGDSWRSHGYFCRLFGTAFSVGSKTLNEKIKKHEKTISIAEVKHLSFRRLFSKAIENDNISDI